MKKITLSFVALAMSAISFAALNPFAYGLSSKLSADETTLTVNYSLNATATAVSVVILDGETVVKTVDCADKGLTKGAYTVEIPTTDFPKTTALTWKVEVSGASVKVPTQETTMYNMYCPHGLAIDKDPESEYFGRILVAEAMQLVKDKSGYIASGKGAGLYVFAPDFTNDGKVYNGGLNFTRILASNGYQPYRVKISEDGRIFVSSLDLNGVVVWEVSKNLQTWTPVISGTNNSTDYNIYDAKGNFVAGINCSMDVIGKGEDLKLLLYSTNNKGIAYNQSGYRLDEYALGTATTWTGTPKNIINGGAYGVVHTNVEFIYDGEGGYWFGGSRAGNAGQPNLVHINAEGEQDYYTEDASLYGGDGVLLHNGMLFKGKARSSETVGNFGVWTIGKDADGKVTLTEKWSVVANGIGRNLNEFAVDYAENLYVVGNSGEKIIAYALPYSGQVVTPAASKYAFQLQEEVVGTFYTVTANVNDPAMGEVTGNEDKYEADATATLTAVPAAGYQFVNWTVGEDTYTANPLEIVVNSNLTITANFKAISYTITANVNKEQYGNVTGGGAYDYNTTATLTASANDGYEFVNWSNGSTDNPLAYTVTKDETITANFRQVLASSITLNALPVQDYSATIVGTLKRALQNGENTIVLTHEANGTPHIYNVAHAIKTVTELSQEGVVAVDSENAGDYLAISDIALTEDGKLVACNYMRCESGTAPAAGYKAGIIRYYIWDNMNEAPKLWFTSNKTANSTYGDVGYTFAVKGSSDNAQVMTTAVHNNNRAARINLHTIVNGTETSYHRFGLHTSASEYTETKQGLNFQLTATPLNNVWTLEGELTDATSFAVPATVGNEYKGTALNGVDLGKKYNGVSYLANYNEHHLMVAPYANGEGYLAGVKVVDIVDGFAAATELTTNTDLATAESATAAAATAVVDAEGKLTIHLFSDAKVYTFTQKEQGPATAVDNTTVAPQVQKIIRDGQVLIIRDGKTFNMMGQEVR